MTDLTAPLNELRAAYRAYQAAKRDKKEEIHEKYAGMIADEIRSAVAEEKRAFATRLADMKVRYDLKVTDIQDHVLRTRNWKVWEDIRDYAKIDPEQVVRDNAREAREIANRPYRWSDDFTELTWMRDLKNKELAKPIRVAVDFNHLHFPDVHLEDKDFAIATFGSLTKFFESVVPVIQEKHADA